MPQETAKVQTSQIFQSMPFLNKPNYIHSPDNEEKFFTSENWETQTKMPKFVT